MDNRKRMIRMIICAAVVVLVVVGVLIFSGETGIQAQLR